MFRCLIWGTGKCFTNNISVIKMHEKLGSIKVIAVTSNAQFLANYGNYPFVKKEFIKTADYDIVIIMVSDKKMMSEIRTEIRDIGFEDSQIIPYHVIGKMGFDFNIYLGLTRHTPSIFALNCWGGVVYNYLGLKFCSPLINMWVRHTDYYKLLKAPEYYMEFELVRDGIGYDSILKRDYPIAKCGDIQLHFNHYRSFEDADNCWNRRKKRIDWDNLFIMDIAENPEFIEEFQKLPYTRKICFVTFPTNESSLVFIDYKDSAVLGERALWEIVNRTADARYLYYDVFQMLSNGKIDVVSSFH